MASYIRRSGDLIYSKSNILCDYISHTTTNIHDMYRSQKIKVSCIIAFMYWFYVQKIKVSCIYSFYVLIICTEDTSFLYYSFYARWSKKVFNKMYTNLSRDVQTTSSICAPQKSPQSKQMDILKQEVSWLIKKLISWILWRYNVTY